MASMKKILITGACGVTSRSVARALRRDWGDELWICGAGIFENEYARHEGVYDITVKVPRVDDSRYSGDVKKLLDKYKFDCVLVVPEPEVLFWSEQKFPVPYLLPSPEFIRAASDKRELGQTLRDTKFVPKSTFFTRDSFSERLSDWGIFPCWLRPCDFGVTSGMGAVKCGKMSDVNDWLSRYPKAINWQIAEFVNGRNIAVSMLFRDSRLVKHGMYERKEYFAGHLFQSGVSGNISRGIIFNDESLLSDVLEAINKFCDLLDVKIDGFITVDLLLGEDRVPKLTEINVRPTAPVEAYSLVNNPIVGNWVECVLGREVSPSVQCVDGRDTILRDIDGRLLVVKI
jgi:predicted ATP-grasp superfamily ATP-dependent carboligase